MMRETPVLIVGAGPVGLSAAVCLGRMGIPCVVIERHPWITNHPKARGVNIRTMELFRQWGIDGEVCRRGLPIGSNRFIYCTSLAGAELGRTTDPGWDEKISPTGRLIVSQDVVEEVLVEAARSHHEVNVFFSTEMVKLVQTEGEVRATLRHVDTGEIEEIGARFAIAADGAGSTIRRLLAVEMDGPGLLGWFASVYYRANLADLTAHRPAAVYFTVDGAQSGAVFSANGTDRWITTDRLAGGTEARPALPPPEHYVAMARRLIGRPDQPVEILDTMIWGMGAMVARQFQVGRVFLAGDAAHRLPPTGGFGMNSGIQDAHNLAWKLALVLRGEASEALLSTYHEERHPVALSNIDWSLANLRRFGRVSEAISSGDRHQLDLVLEEQRDHMQPDGQDIGFSYENGAVIPDGFPAPSSGGRHYSPSDRPGSRYPHAWIRSGGRKISTLDLFELRFTLLAGAGAGSIATAGCALSHSLPLAVHQLNPGENVGGAVDVDGAVLVRPDGHVAWRAGIPPGDSYSAIRDAMHQLLSSDDR